MRVAAVISSTLQLGGGFQQELSTAVMLKHARYEGVDFVFVTTRPENVDVLAEHGIAARYVRDSLLDSVLLEVRRSRLGRRICSWFGLSQSSFERYLHSMDVDLVYFLSPNLAALKLSRLGYFFTVWDLCHRDFVEFPEVSADGEFELREYLFRAALPRASAIFADSEHGKKNLMRRYGIDESRIHVTPFLPSEGILSAASELDAGDRVVKKFALARPFVFYPAQFWGHKNHVVIVDALANLSARHGTLIDAVFCGSDKGNLKYVLDYARGCGMAEQVRYLGFVDSGDLVGLYRAAVALVMPTYFGPTNIPPLEAFASNCAVIYSKLDGTDEAYREAIFEFDNEDPVALANAILTVMGNADLRDRKKRAGAVLLQRFRRADYERGVGLALATFRARVRSFGHA